MFTLPEARPAIMGVLNVTPDSFSDGGRFGNAREAVDAALVMVDEGADLIDVGGESTRPGAAPVSVEEEIDRVLEVVRMLAARDVSVSIDTSKPEVARACLEHGAVVVNDVTALASDGMVEVCLKAACTVCLMHMQGDPRTMQTSPHYGNVVEEVKSFLLKRAKETGLPNEQVWIDPGIGFGKTLEHNLELLRKTGDFVATGYPVLIGVSRKSFLGKLLNGAPADQRLEGTLAAQVLAQASGAKVIRAHDVSATKKALTVAQAVLGSTGVQSAPDAGRRP